MVQAEYLVMGQYLEAATRCPRVLRVHEPGASVAVIGLGGVGLSCVMGAALAGAGRIVAIDRVPDKLDAARHVGATDTVVAGADRHALLDALPLHELLTASIERMARTLTGREPAGDGSLVGMGVPAVESERPYPRPVGPRHELRRTAG